MPYHSGMLSSREIRRLRLHQLILEVGSQADLARRINKSPKLVSAWAADLAAASAKPIGHKAAREIEAACLKPSGWLDTEQGSAENPSPAPALASHFGGIDPDILHEAETLVLSDEAQAGKKYRPRERSRQLARAYNLLLSESGTLSPSTNARFVDSVNERMAGGEDDGRRAGEDELREVGAKASLD